MLNIDNLFERSLQICRMLVGHLMLGMGLSIQFISKTFNIFETNEVHQHGTHLPPVCYHQLVPSLPWWWLQYYWWTWAGTGSAVGRRGQTDSRGREERWVMLSSHVLCFCHDMFGVFVMICLVFLTWYVWCFCHDMFDVFVMICLVFLS